MLESLCPAPPASGGYVNVQIKSDAAMPTLLGGFLPNRSEVLGGCSQARWGSPVFTSGIALTISYCAWNQSVNPPGPGYVDPYPPNPAASYERLFNFHGNSTATTGTSPCPAPSSGGTPISGGFGSTCEVGANNCSNTGSDCATATNRLPNNWFDNNPGNSIDSLCRDVLFTYWQNHQPMLIPVYDCTSNVASCLTQYPCSTCSTNGSNSAYHLASLAAFVVTTYHLQSSNETQLSWLPGSPYAATAPCSGSTTCIGGFFVRVVTTGPIQPGGSGNYGVSSVALSG